MYIVLQLVALSSQNERIFDIADAPFALVSEEEKQKYQGRMLETGSYQGYKLRQYLVGDNVPSDQFCFLTHSSTSKAEYTIKSSNITVGYEDKYSFQYIDPHFSQQGHHQERASCCLSTIATWNWEIRETQPLWCLVPHSSVRTRISDQAFTDVLSGRLLALGLELPEDTFVNIHGFEDVSESYGMIVPFGTWKLFIWIPSNYSCRM